MASVHAFKRDTETPGLICAADLAGKPVPERRYIVREIIPDNTVSNLAGDGGLGKSLLAIDLAVSVVMGQPWLGFETTRGPVIFLSAEDDLDEIHRRLIDVAEAKGVRLEDLVDLKIMPLAGRDAVLAGFDKAGTLSRRPLWDQLRTIVEEHHPKLVILDTLADVFSGNEIDRTQARAFVGLLRGLAIEFDLAVLTLSHPSLTGMASKTGTSGSTGWSNSVRSRLYLDYPKVDDGAEPDPDLRVLTVKKANYTRKGKEVHLRWIDGVFHLGTESFFDKVAANQRVETVFLDLLRQFSAQGRKVSHQASPSYAPRLFERHPSAAGITSRAFQRAMETLLARGAIVVETVGPPSRQYSKLVIKDAG